jgi:hypothetical protein
MRATAAFLVCLVCATATTAQDGEPVWLPPPKPRAMFWDLSRDVPDSRPDEGFSDLLLHVSRPDTGFGMQSDPYRLKLSRESAFDAAKVKASLELPDSREMQGAPFLARDWKGSHSVNVPLPVAESVFVFGEHESSGDALNNQSTKIKGRTGFGWKWSPFHGGELQVRTGTLVNYSDLYNPARPAEKSQLSVELQAKLALFGPLQLQYSGEALPALTAADRNSLLQDLKIALPFGTNREFQFGAKYRWDELRSSPWLDRAQIYVGLKFQH